jgi:hypothetical protein
VFVSAEELRRAAEEAAGGSGGDGMTAMQVARKLAQQTSLAAVKRNGPPAVPMPHDHDLGDIMDEFTRALSDRSSTSELSFAGQVCSHTDIQTHSQTLLHVSPALSHKLSHHDTSSQSFFLPPFPFGRFESWDKACCADGVVIGSGRRSVAAAGRAVAAGAAHSRRWIAAGGTRTQASSSGRRPRSRVCDRALTCGGRATSPPRRRPRHRAAAEGSQRGAQPAPLRAVRFRLQAR